MPAGYQDAAYHFFSSYDAGTQTAATLNPVNGDQNGVLFVPPSGYGGVILADSTSNSTNHAMGIYSVLISASPAGTSQAFKVLDLRSNPTPLSPVVSWQVIRGGPFPAGTSTYRSWILTGTVDDVRAGMDALYAAGVH